LRPLSGYLGEVNTYAIWVDLAPGVEDLAFSRAVHAYMGWFEKEGLLLGWRLQRRKLGFGPDGLGEWHIQMDFRDLAQLDEAFLQAAKRSGEVEGLHADVYRRVTNFKSALYRDFPDPVREPS
jgi:hypothetical protein